MTLQYTMRYIGNKQPYLLATLLPIPSCLYSILTSGVGGGGPDITTSPPSYRSSSTSTLHATSDFSPVVHC